MARPVNVYEHGQDNVQDLKKILVILNPGKNKLVKMAKFENTTSERPTWPEFIITKDTDINAKSDTQDITDDDPSETKLRGNSCQNMTKTFKITKAAMKTEKTKLKEKAKRKMEATVRLEGDLELSMLKGVENEGDEEEGTSTARQMDGLLTLATAYGQKQAISTNADLDDEASEDKFNLLLAAISDDSDAEPDTVVMSSGNKLMVSKWTGGNTRSQLMDKAKITSVVSVYEGDGGTVTFEKHSKMANTDGLLVLEKSRISLLWYWTPEEEILAKTGLGERYMLSQSVTLKYEGYKTLGIGQIAA